MEDKGGTRTVIPKRFALLAGVHTYYFRKKDSGDYEYLRYVEGVDTEFSNNKGFIHMSAADLRDGIRNQSSWKILAILEE